MTLEVEQAGRQELTTEAPQSSEDYRMSKEGSQVEAEVNQVPIDNSLFMRKIKVRGIAARMEGLEKRQEEIVRILNSLRLFRKVTRLTQDTDMIDPKN